MEEAKKRMYALSTTTYQGFQAVMTEEMSEKFHGSLYRLSIFQFLLPIDYEIFVTQFFGSGLPGVFFVLPDSYIDPVNKEYGGVFTLTPYIVVHYEGPLPGQL